MAETHPRPGLLLSGIVVMAAGAAGELLVLGPVFALAGAISAAGTLALARAAEKRELLDAGTGAAESVPNKREARTLFGRRS